jgi:hypothetical protein
VLQAGIVLRLNENPRLEAAGLNPQGATGEPNRSCADAPEPFQLFGLTQFLASTSGNFPFGSVLQEFVNERLVGLCLFGSETAELNKKPRGDTDGNQLFGVASDGPSHAAGTAELLVRGFRNIGKVQLTIRHMPGVPCASPSGR